MRKWARVGVAAVAVAGGLSLSTQAASASVRPAGIITTLAATNLTWAQCVDQGVDAVYGTSGAYSYYCVDVNNGYYTWDLYLEWY